ELTQIDGIGPEVAGSIVHFFSEKGPGQAIIKRLKDAGVAMKQTRRKPVTDGPLSGKIVVVTGTLESMGRKEAQDLIKQLGGKTAGSVSKKTDLVVYGDSPGSKLEKAQELGLRTVDEKEFLALIRRTP
ncbi:MAG: NAD-dependent DNA ligase LigA, partial [Planctomycetes bacterium]|nr:NAD-dependent DNA ligase LigA [Planctomycetota bacterium]